MNETVILVGGAGFIGTAITLELVRTRPDINVVIIDSLASPHSVRNSQFLLNVPNLEFLPVRVEECLELPELVSNASCVINLAAQSNVDISIAAPVETITCNLNATRILLETLRLHNKMCRYVQVSTDEIFGSSDALLAGGYGWPSSPYAASKAATEILVMAYAKSFDLDVVVTRGCNTYGPRQSRFNLIPKASILALQGQPTPIYGHGKQIRRWIHANDHARGILEAAQYGDSRQVFDIQPRVRLSNLEVVATIWDHIGSPMQIEFVPDRLAHDNEYEPRSLGAIPLSVEPAVSFHDGIRETIEYYRQDLSDSSETKI